MCQCTLCADRFLRDLLGSPPFEEYCRARNIRPPPRLSEREWGEAVLWWTATLRSLPDGVREQVEWEQLAVSELATPSGYYHLLAASVGMGTLPAEVSAGLPGALWFLLRQPSLFREVYCQHSHREPNVWRAARAAKGLALPQPGQVETPLASGLGRLFGEFTRAGGECVVTAHRIPGAIYVSARLGAAEGVSAARPAAFADFVYYPEDGTLLLRSPWRAAERARELLDCFSGAALGTPLKELQPGFALDRLKEPFRPLPDADDVVSVRVKALHLRYPGRRGRRELRLQTLTSDSQTAVEEMVRAHGGRDIDELRVSHAVLQVRMRLQGCEKTHLVRLWPDRCDAGQGPFRTRVLASLRHWGF